MRMSLEQLEAEALNLPIEDRARLAQALITSLDEQAEIERAWAEEVQRRLAQIRSGEVQAIPAEEVFSELDALLKK